MMLKGDYFIIKKINQADINQIFGVYKQCEDFLSLGPVPYASKQMIYDDLNLSKNMGGIFCGIYINDIMVGIIDFVLSNYDDNPNEAYLSLLMISNCYRGKGLGRDVVNIIEKEILKNNNITAILAGVQTNNKPAIAFWLSLGYRIISGPELLPDKTITYKLKKEIL